MFYAADNTIALNCSTASVTDALDLSKDPFVYVGNNSDAWLFVAFGASDITATFPTTSTPQDGYFVGPGLMMFFKTGGKPTYVAAALSSGTGKAYLTPGSLP